MKLLLDENLPHELRGLLPGHQVYTVQFMGWGGTKNAKLLERAVSEGFDAIVTMDGGIPKQHKLAKLPIAVIVLEAASNNLHDLRPLVPNVLRAIKHLKPGTYVRIQ